jgi:TPR repeat protein
VFVTFDSREYVLVLTRVNQHSSVGGGVLMLVSLRRRSRMALREGSTDSVHLSPSLWKFASTGLPHSCSLLYARFVYLDVVQCGHASLVLWALHRTQGNLSMMSLRTLGLLTISGTLWSCTAFADFEQGKAASDRDDWPQALSEWRTAAAAGNARAEWGLGSLYAQGRGVPRDAKLAATWFRKAAKHGDREAQFALGSLYLTGVGATQDAFYAVGWFRKAAEHGHAEAQYQLGRMCMSGKGVPVDVALGASWLRKSAEQGFPPAQRELGNLLQNGWGSKVEKDPKAAFEWTSKAAEQGDAEAQYDVCIDYRFGDGVPPDQDVARTWCRKSAEQGYADAQYQLGLLSPDDAALVWYRKAAAQGHVAALYQLGSFYERGVGVAKDAAQARVWYEKAAESVLDPGGPRRRTFGTLQRRAQARLAQMYSTGEVGQQDVRKALQWMLAALNDTLAYDTASYHTQVEERNEILSTTDLGWIEDRAVHGNADAQEFMGKLCDDGWGRPQNRSAAFGWYRKAARQGNVRAQAELFEFYANGIGVARDVSQALAWGEKAAARDRASKIMLGAAFVGDGAPDFPKNEARAMALFDQARAYRSLGVMYQYRHRRDDAKSKAYFQKAIDQGDVLAVCNMAMLYIKDLRTPDKVEGYRWLVRAVWTAREHDDPNGCDDAMLTKLVETMTPAERRMAETDSVDR